MQKLLESEQTSISLRANHPVGRENIKIAIHRFLTDAESSPIAEISGERGLGKTLLLNEFQTELKNQNREILSLDDCFAPTILNALLKFSENSDENRKERIETVLLLEKFYRKAKELGGVVILADNTDFGDESGNAIIDEILAFPAEAGVKIIATHRSQIPQFGSRADVHTLSNLLPVQIRALCKEILGECEFSDNFVKNLLHRTKGHPLFVEELLRKLVADGIISEREGIFANTQDGIDAPATLAGLITLRIEILSADERKILQILSIVGCPISLQLLAEASEVPEVFVVEALQNLISSGFVLSQNSLAKIAHELYAEAILQQLDEHKVADLKEKILAVLLAKKENFTEKWAEKLRIILGEPKSVARATGNMGIILTELKRYDQAQESFRAAAAMFKKIGDTRGKLTAIEHLIQLYLVNSRFAEAEISAKKALELAETLGAEEEIAKIGKLLGSIRATLETNVNSLDKTTITFQTQEISTLDALETGILSGKSGAIKSVRKLIRVAAGCDAPVLLEGEFGVGKSVLSQKMHEISSRRNEPFLTINCEDFSEQDLEIEIFGLNSPDENLGRSGLVSECRGGTLFLNDITKTTARFQSKVALLLQSGEYRSVSDTNTKKANLRVMVGCEIPSEQAVQQSLLQKNLYYLLTVLRIPVPSLAERREDIPAIARYYLQIYNARLGKNISRFSPKLLQSLTLRRWQGNLSELESTIHRLMIFEQAEVLTGEFGGMEFSPQPVATIEPEMQAEAVSGAVKSFSAEILSIDDAQKIHILRAMEQTNGNKTKAAKVLNIKRTTLLARMKKFGMEV